MVEILCNLFAAIAILVGWWWLIERVVSPRDEDDNIKGPPLL
jgi:flagellar biogenesis protein FliO